MDTETVRLREEVEQRRAALQARLDSDAPIVLVANELLQRSNDSAFEFCQDSSFYYFTGIIQPGYLLVIDQRAGSQWLLAPPRSDVEVLFGGAPDPAVLSATSGIPEIVPNGEGTKRLQNLLATHGQVHTLLPPPPKLLRQEGMLTSPARRRAVTQWRRRVPRLQLNDISSHVIGMRQYKSAYEIHEIQRAVDITASALATAAPYIAGDCTEHQVRGAAVGAMVAKGSNEAYESVIASGPRSTVLHAPATSKVLCPEEPVLLDIGAIAGGYCADVSRTYCVGKPSARLTQVMAAVESVHHEAISLLRVGMQWRELAIEVDQIMGRRLIELGLIRTADQVSIRRYFGHSISHSLGLDVHDPCDYRSTIENGTVLTIEPGIYIPDESIGVRIEDDIAIIDSKPHNLSQDIPYNL